MFQRILILCALPVSLAASVAGACSPDGCGARQYYGSWQYNAPQGYYYRSYYYKPTPTYTGYKHHYAVYYPTRPKYVYFYSPYAKSYWGRCATTYPVGKPQYSVLAEADRKGSLANIPEKAFSAPGAMPPVPESRDGAAMQPPPDDLPGTEPLPK